MDIAEVEDLLRSEMARVTQPQLAQVIKAHLVTIRLEQRNWDYGSPGERFPCFIVWEHAPSKTAVGYCAHGFGPSQPWGLLFVDVNDSLGMDCQWYVNLEDAVRESHAWTGDTPPGYEVD